MTSVPVDEQFSLLKKHAFEHCRRLQKPVPGYTLIFSVSDGDSRAIVRHACAPVLDAAWDMGERAIREEMRRSNLSGRHLRVDWVEEAVNVQWGEFQKHLSSIKRSYFRFGIALDPQFTCLLTEMECHANAIYYGGSEMPSGQFNPGNFAFYAKTRFDFTAVLPSSADEPIWLIHTSGAYCGPDGVLLPIPGLLPADVGVVSRGLYAGHRKIPQLTPELLRDVVGNASQWLVNQIQPDGKFTYGYFPCFDRPIATYNSLRHATSLYSLLDVVEFTGNRSLLEPVERSIRFMVKEFIREYEPAAGKCVAFLEEPGAKEIKLGANGGALLALAKYQELTGSREFAGLMTLLAEGIAYMQAPETGRFTHVLHSGSLAVKEPYRIIYYDGEAVFGLLRCYAQDKNPRWLGLARDAFEYFLTSEEHAKAHDHWLSYAANEIFMHIPDERYCCFGINNCVQLLEFILRRETTFPTLLELLAAAQKMFELAEKRKMLHLMEAFDMEQFKQALHFRAHYLLNGYFWPEVAMFFKNPDRIAGSFFIRHHAFRTRIDDTQHYLSGLAAYGSLLAKKDPRWSAPLNPEMLGSRMRKAVKC